MQEIQQEVSPIFHPFGVHTMQAAKITQRLSYRKPLVQRQFLYTKHNETKHRLETIETHKYDLILND